MQDRIQFSATINRKKIGPVDVPKDLMMIEFLQEYAGMNGTRLGCGQGVCRACTIIVDDPEKGSITVPACVTGVTWLNGKTIRTVEGIASVDDKGVVHPSPVQKAFLEHYSFQCGYCTSGQICSSVAVLKEIQDGIPSHVTVDLVSAPETTADEIRERMSGNICRCGAYANILAAIEDAAGEIKS